jgi:hypothetical protein
MLNSRELPISKTNKLLAGDAKWDNPVSMPMSDIQEGLEFLGVLLSDVGFICTPDVYWALLNHPATRQQPLLFYILSFHVTLLEGSGRLVLCNSQVPRGQYDIFPFGHIPEGLNFETHNTIENE